MSSTKKSKKQPLRQRAEKPLSENSQIVSKVEDKDVKKLVHELHAHQIELEMQNEELRRDRAEIEESRTMYSDLYDFARVGYFTFSQRGEILEVNPTGANLLSVERTKLLHSPFSTFVDPDFHFLFSDHRLNLLKPGAKERCELKLIGKNGEPFYASLESISAPDGKTFRIRSVVTDITELKKAQEKAETEHAFRIAVENSILPGIAAVDLDGRQSYVNNTFCRMVGRSEEELLGRKPPFAYWPPEKLDHITRAFHTVMSGKASRDGLELRLMRKNGERFDVLVLPSPLKDREGKVVGWIGTFGDVTHLKQMENELKQLDVQLEERVRQRTAEVENANEYLKQEITERKRAEESLHYLASFPEINPNPIVEVDLAGTLHYLNPAAKELFPDLTTSGIQHPSLAGLESFASTLKEEIKGPLRHEVKIGNFWYDQAFSRVPNTDRIRIYSRDITERKQAQMLSQSLNDISLVINSTLDFDEIVNRVVAQACEAIGAESAAISLRKGNEWVVSYVYGFPEDFIGAEMVDEQEPHALLAIKTKQVVVINDVFNDGRVNREHMQKHNVRSVIVIPLVTKERVIGVLFVNHHSAPVTFASAQIDFARKLGHSLGLALENTRLFDELQRSRDELEIRVQERTAELAKVNEELRGEIAARKQTEEALRKLTHDLNERVKQLNLLYSISYYVERQYTRLEEKLQNIAHLISSGWQYPQVATARIVLGGNGYKADNFRETAWKQASDIIVHGETVGSIEVCYLKERPTCYEGPFTKEERGLINAIAVELGEMIGYMKSDKAVTEQSKILEGFFTSTITPLVFLDRNFNFVRVNEAYANTCQRDISEFPGHNHFEFYPHE